MSPADQAARTLRLAKQESFWLGVAFGMLMTTIALFRSLTCW
jgi:hypothetical protein